MPWYEYECKRCGKRFEVQASVKEKSRLKPSCPGCGSRDVKQVFSVMMVSVKWEGGGENSGSNKSQGGCPTCGV